MTDIQTPSRPHSLGSSIRALSDKWGWFVALGLVYIAAGAFALVTVVPATVASVYLIGAMMLVAGVSEIIAAFQMRTWSRFALWMLLGAMYTFAGVMTFTNPLLAATTLTMLLGIALIATGALRIVVGFQMKGQNGWWMVVVSGVITLLLGAMILARWPASSLYTLGIFLGLDLVFAGLAWVTTGMTIRRLTDGR